MIIAKEYLIQARELITQGWTQGSHAKTATGSIVPPWNKDAVCFCSSGAFLHIQLSIDCIIRESFSKPYSEEESIEIDKKIKINNGIKTIAKQAILDLIKPLGFELLSTWNDQATMTKEEILLVFDEAISRIES